MTPPLAALAAIREFSTGTSSPSVGEIVLHAPALELGIVLELCFEAMERIDARQGSLEEVREAFFLLGRFWASWTAKIFRMDVARDHPHHHFEEAEALLLVLDQRIFLAVSVAGQCLRAVRPSPADGLSRDGRSWREGSSSRADAWSLRPSAWSLAS